MIKHLLFIQLFILSIFTFGQDANAYMNSVSVEYVEIQKDAWSYIKKASHSKNARKIESKRIELIKTINAAKNKISKMPVYQNDASFRDAVVKFLSLYSNVLSEDFSKIVDMEEIAEQSYDDMEAYMMAKEQANDKLSEAGKELDEVQNKFAEAHDVKLVEGEQSKRSKKLETASKVYKYYNKAYLIFFKSYKQEAYLLESTNKRDVNGVEQNRTVLGSDAQQGLTDLAKLGSYNGDASIVLTLRELLNFYKHEGNIDAKATSDFFLKKEKFEKIQKSMESKKKPTQDEINTYNKALEEYNASVNKFNATNETLNKKRDKLLNAYNKAVENFLNKQVP